MNPTHYRPFLIAIFALFYLALSPPAPGQATPPADRAVIEGATPDPAWDAAFTRTSGWNGGDICHSIDLAGRTVWLFGDSFIGPVQNGRRVAGNTMLRSAIAWHDAPAHCGDPPAQVRFGVPRETVRDSRGTDPGSAPWLVPEPGLFPDDAWYWMMGDGIIVQRESGERLVLFASAIGPSGNPQGMWNFRRVGGVIFSIDNPRDPPDRWRASQRTNPIVGEEPHFGVESDPEIPRDNWGLALVRWPAASNSIYIYGVRSLAGGRRDLLLARATDATLENPSRWEFCTGDAWSTEPTAATGLAPWIPDEFTIHAVGRDGKTLLVMIHSEMILGRRIMARTARSPSGPWSEPAPVFTVTGPESDSRLITYAAKGHASLSRSGELLVSYVINSTEFGQVLRDASLYRPRFVGVPLALLPDPPASPP
ncbi:MAG: hypothetical protein H6811_01450 [Phycisphaeraceae bacterium]|nr:hypothetical protein [Phycisphaeraceae bacterium]